MQMYQCPNCGRKYTEFENKFYCGTCNYRLKKQEDIQNINNPDLYTTERKIIGTVSISNGKDSKPTCPTCKSTNIRPISGTKRFISVGLFGLASSTIGKSYECLSCKYKW